MSRPRTTGAEPPDGETAPGRHTSPSWTDALSSGTPSRPSESSRHPRPRAYRLIVALSIIAALLFPALVLAPPAYRDGRLLLPFLGLALLWITVVCVGAIAILRRLSGPRRAHVRRPQSREEKRLARTGVFIAFLAVLLRPNMPRAAWLWLWAGCAVLAAALAVDAMRRAPAGERRYITFAVYGVIAALVLGVPVESLPAQFRRRAPFVVAATGIAVGVLMMLNAARHGEASAAEEPAGRGPGVTSGR